MDFASWSTTVPTEPNLSIICTSTFWEDVKCVGLPVKISYSAKKMKLVWILFYIKFLRGFVSNNTFVCVRNPSSYVFCWANRQKREYPPVRRRRDFFKSAETVIFFLCLGLCCCFASLEKTRRLTILSVPWFVLSFEICYMMMTENVYSFVCIFVISALLLI